MWYYSFVNPQWRRVTLINSCFWWTMNVTPCFIEGKHKMLEGEKKRPRLTSNAAAPALRWARSSLITHRVVENQTSLRSTMSTPRKIRLLLKKSVTLGERCSQARKTSLTRDTCQAGSKPFRAARSRDEFALCRKVVGENRAYPFVLSFLMCGMERTILPPAPPYWVETPEHLPCELDFNSCDCRGLSRYWNTAALWPWRRSTGIFNETIGAILIVEQ